MFLATHKTSLNAALAVLAIALPLGSQAFAQTATSIDDGVRAAQSVIVDSSSQPSSHVAAYGTSERVTLADNERAAQRAIAGSPASDSSANDSRHQTFGGATLARSERAAQEAIAGSVLSQRDARGTHAAGSIGSVAPATDATSMRGN